MITNNELLIKDENDDDNSSFDIGKISELAEKILSSENYYDEYDDEENENSHYTEVVVHPENNEKSSNQEEKEEYSENIDEEQYELIKKANALLNNDSNQNLTPEENEKLMFGNYEIIHSNPSRASEKYTKLVEDHKINEFEHEPTEVTVNKIKSSVDKYIDERQQIQNFLSHNNKEIKISEARSLIEACLFVLGSDGLNAYDIKKVTDLPLSIVNNILDEMVHYYQKNKNSGLLLAQYGNKYKFVTKSQHHNFISLVLNKKEQKALPDSILETLAVIAYNQPCTKSTVEKIRRKSCVTAIEKLKELNLIEADERSEAMGKPWLYSVTQKFFDLYGIKSLSELPAINRDDKFYSDEMDENVDFLSEINEEN